MLQGSALQEGLRQYESTFPTDPLPYLLFFGIPIVLTIAVSLILHLSHQQYWKEEAYHVIRAGHTKTALSIGGLALLVCTIGFFFYVGKSNDSGDYQQALEDSVMENYQVDEVTILDMSRDKTQEKFFPAKIVPLGESTVVEAEIIHNTKDDFAMVLEKSDNVMIEPREGSVAAQHVE